MFDFLKYNTMEKIIKTVLYVILGAVVVTATAYFYASDIYHYAVAEDGVFETITALLLLSISVLFFMRLVKTRKNRNKYWMILNVLIVVGAFFGFGEEISWGQRIFSIDSGDFFTQNNLQNETNLHNLEIGGVNINKLIFSQGLVLVFGFYFVFAQVCHKRFSFFRNLVDLFGVQIPRLQHSLIILAGTGLVLAIPETRIWELWEAIFVAVLLLVFIDPLNEKERLLSVGNAV